MAKNKTTRKRVYYIGKPKISFTEVMLLQVKMLRLQDITGNDQAVKKMMPGTKRKPKFI